MSLMEPKIDLVSQFFNSRLDSSIEKCHLVIKAGFEDTRSYINNYFTCLHANVFQVF